MKIKVMRNQDLLEPYEGLPGRTVIIMTEDGYIYWGDTSRDPIDRGDWEDWDAPAHEWN
jgi:hypothetical protein